MDAFSLVVGLAAGIMIGVILASLRRTPRLGGGPEAAAPDPSATRRLDSAPAPDGIATSRDAQGHLHLTRRVIRHEARAVVGPTGTTFEVDGTSYDSVDDIPDPTTRENLRALLAEAPSRVTDPAARERLVEELHGAGVEAASAVDAAAPDDTAARLDEPPADASAPRDASTPSA